MKDLLLILCVCFVCMNASAQLTITEIMYNNPSEDLYEYIEVANTSGAALNISAYKVSAGFNADFPDMMIDPGSFFYVVSDSAAFLALFDPISFVVIQATGALNNEGERIAITDITETTIIDEVTYSDGDDWPSFADGNGPSILLCNINSDNNDGENWSIAASGSTLVIDSQRIYTDVGDISSCSKSSPSFFRNTLQYTEGSGIVNIPINIDFLNTDLFDIEIAVQSGTAVEGVDFEIVNKTIAVDILDSTNIYDIELQILDDSILEMDESFTISFPKITDDYFALTHSVEVSIIDNDTPLTEKLILTGIFDAHPGFSGTKGVEMYVVDDIADLSVFGIGVVNNGNGTDGVEYTFPDMSLTAGAFIYLVEDSTEFTDYFRQDADFIFGGINVNGNDAIELFENGQPLDVFGEVDMDGTGTAWEYLDGWVYRVDGTGPDGSTFFINNWKYSGIDALDGPATNSESNIPFPIGTYTTMLAVEVVANDDVYTFPFGTTTATLEVAINDENPGGIGTYELFNLPAEIILQANADFIIEANIPFGYCGTENFSYRLTNPNSSDDANVAITVSCPTQYPALDIGIVSTEDALGLADSIGTICELRGTVYGTNLSDDGILFTIIDDNGDGIAVSNNIENLGYSVTEGDKIIVQGTISQFFGLTQIAADNISLLEQGATLKSSEEVNILDESTESQLVTLPFARFQDPAQWGDGNSGFNIIMLGQDDEQFVVRIDNNIDLFMMPIPSGSSFFRVTGLGGQFDNSSPFTEGYQILPRYAKDFETGLDAYKVLHAEIEMYPNPTAKAININSNVSLDQVIISDVLGNAVTVINKPNKILVLDVHTLVAGIYTVSCIRGQDIFAMRLIVQ